eukprot:6902_1
MTGVTFPFQSIKEPICTFATDLSTKRHLYSHKIHSAAISVFLQIPQRKLSIELTTAPSQSLTVEIFNDEMLYAQICESDYNQKQESFQKCNWNHCRSIYNQLTTLSSQQQYIKNISNHIKIKSIIIMDFDDTIFPTSAFQILKQHSLQKTFLNLLINTIINFLFYPDL